MKVEQGRDTIRLLRMITNDVSAATSAPKGVEHAGVIDFMGFDSKTGEVLLVIIESRPWDESQRQLFQLQEKLNAYFSFILDGEMLEVYPKLKDKPVRVRLECVTPPHSEAVTFLQAVYDQAALQGISFEVEVMGKGCGCGNPAGSCSKQ